MRHGAGYRKIGRVSAHRKAMLRNMVISLFFYGKIQTTLCVAKEARRLAEKIITFAKKKNEFMIIKTLNDKKIFKKVLEYGVRYQNRNGGYTRIIRLEPRKGDQASMSLLELVE